jgi:hypothetical protein
MFFVIGPKAVAASTAEAAAGKGYFNNEGME